MSDFGLHIGTRDSSGTVDVDLIDLGAKKINVHDLTISLDAPRTLVFSQVNRLQWDGEFKPGQWVEFYDHATITTAEKTLFKGRIVDREADGTPGNIRITYKCMGPRYIANADVTVMSAVATAARTNDIARPFTTYNARRGDPDYDESREWMTVGDIIADLFVQCSGELFKVGACASATPADNYSSDELGFLTVTPPEAVVFSNTGFTAAIEELMEYQPQFMWFIDPATLKWRFRDIEDTTSAYGMSELDIQLCDAETYQVMKDNINESIDDCATRMVIHGGKKTTVTEFVYEYGGSSNTMTFGWDQTLESTWTMQDSFHRRPNDFAGGPPEKIIDTSVTTVTYPTTSSIVINGASLDFNIYRSGWVEFLSDDLEPANQIEHRKISGNDNATNSTVNFSPVLLMDPDAVKRIRLLQPVNQMWYVWRRFELVGDAVIAEITDPWMAVAGGKFDTNVIPTLQAEITTDGGTTFRLNAAAEVMDGGTAVVAQFPLCSLVMTPSDMYTAGVPTGPSNVFLTAPKIDGNLTSIWPRNTNLADPSDDRSGTTPAYEGTAKTLFDVEVTRDIYIPDWKNDQQQALFDHLAQQKLKPLQNVQIQGSIPIAGFNKIFALRDIDAFATPNHYPKIVTITLPAGLDEDSFIVKGIPVSSASAYSTTNWSGLLIKSVTYSWARTGGPAITTTLTMDNNQREGREEDELMFAVKNASTFVEVRYDFDAMRPGHIGTMVVGVNQRIMNPDLVR
tara:strand:- start:13173 stop:15389 length:2217 start_codon:yes stop_codon:yes gene_type:complete